LLSNNEFAKRNVKIGKAGHNIVCLIDLTCGFGCRRSQQFVISPFLLSVMFFYHTYPKTNWMSRDLKNIDTCTRTDSCLIFEVLKTCINEIHFSSVTDYEAKYTLPSFVAA